jgi:hypothetical protein
MRELINVIGPWLVGVVMIGVPVWLAWWLDDGFIGWGRLDPPPISYRSVCNPRTGKTSIAPVNAKTGFPVSYPD